jgi:hypothetical protein
MSSDEIFVLVVCTVTAFSGWLAWYYRLLSVTTLAGDLIGRWTLAIAPIVCMGGLYGLLRTAASFDVRDSSTYLFFYVVMGAAWLVMGRWGFPALGISWRDDALERRNIAATTLIAMAFIGLTACYAGANIGDGPGWWCVVIAGGVATVAWFGLWAVLQAVCHLAETIIVERDATSAFRFGAYLIASGLICGRGAAGDWTSAGQTVIEFQVAWPVLVLALIAGAVEFWLARRPLGSDRTGTSALSLIVFTAYLGFAVWFLVQAPSLPQNPIYDR